MNIEKLVQQYSDECTNGEYDYLDKNHLQKFAVSVYNQAIDDFATEIKNVMGKRYMHDIYIDDVNAITNHLKKGTNNEIN